MQSLTILRGALAFTVAAAAAPVFAQSSPQPAVSPQLPSDWLSPYHAPKLAQTSQPAAPSQSSSSWVMPYKREFWGYAGGSIGQTEYDLGCGANCDDSHFGFKVFAGGSLNRTFGGEIAYVDFGKAKFTTGDSTIRGINLSLTGGVPFGESSRVFAKVGTLYSWAKVNGVGPVLAADKDNGFDLSYGLGATMGINRNWQVRLDWDRYRIDFNGGRSDTDLFTAGLQYRFQ